MCGVIAVRPKSKVGNLPLLLGFSIQPGIPAPPYPSRDATKRSQRLAYELHIPYARPKVSAPPDGPASASAGCGTEWFTYRSEENRFMSFVIVEGCTKD